MIDFFLETTAGKSIRWIVLIILLIIPLFKIVHELQAEIAKEKGVIGIEQAVPIEQKTPLGRILHAIDTKDNFRESYSIYESEKHQLPAEITDYLGKFYEFCFDENINELNISNYSYLIKGATYIKNYMESQKVDAMSLYRSFEVVPYTFLKDSYTLGIIRQNPVYWNQLLELCDQYQKTIVEPMDAISGRGATVFCINIKLQYERALGGVLKRNKTEQLKQIVSQIDQYKEIYFTSLGKNGTLASHIKFLDSYKKSADSIIDNNDFFDRVGRKIWGSESDPETKIPGIDIQ